MIAKAGNIATRFILLVASAGCVLLASYGAVAAPIEACDQRILDAAQAKAQAHVVYDVATIDERVDQTDSVLAMTCFNNIAGTAEDATPGIGGASIFSGNLDTVDFPATGTNTYYKDVIEQALTGAYDDFNDADGNISTSVDYGQTTITSTPACQEEKDLYDQIKKEGVRQKLPFVTEDDLMTGTIPAGAGTKMTNDWNLDTAHFTTFQTNMNTLTTAAKPITPLFAAPYTTTYTTVPTMGCGALITAGVTATCP